MPSRNKVVIKSSEGNMANSSGSRIVMVITRIIMERDIFKIIATSTSAAGIGMISSNTTVSTNSTTE